MLCQHPVALLLSPFLSQTGSCCIALADLKLRFQLLGVPHTRASPASFSVFRQFHKFLALTLNSL